MPGCKLNVKNIIGAREEKEKKKKKKKTAIKISSDLSCVRRLGIV